MLLRPITKLVNCLGRNYEWAHVARHFYRTNEVINFMMLSTGVAHFTYPFRVYLAIGQRVLNAEQCWIIYCHFGVRPEGDSPWVQICSRSCSGHLSEMTLRTKFPYWWLHVQIWRLTGWRKPGGNWGLDEYWSLAMVPHEELTNGLHWSFLINLPDWW